MPLRCRMVRGQGQYTHTSSLVRFHIDRVDNLGTDYCNPRRWRYLLGQSSNTSRICPGELRTHNLHIFVDKDRWTGKHWYLHSMKIRCFGKNSTQFVTLLPVLDSVGWPVGLKERRPKATPWSSCVGIHDSPDGQSRRRFSQSELPARDGRRWDPTPPRARTLWYPAI